MNDLRPWPRNPSTPTGRFIIPTNCRCRMCREAIPWRTLGVLALVFGVLILALN